MDEKNKVLYVGKAINLKSRVSSYFAKSGLGEKTKLMVSKINRIRIITVESELEALLLEAFYIKKYKARYNVKLADGKAYVLIKINLKDKYPAVLISRKKDDLDSVYFGPYPNSSAVRTVLRVIRKAFPYQSVLNHPKKTCLYNHIGLCPCPNVYDSPVLQKEYKKNIKNIIRILEGKSKKILIELEKKRDKRSETENYEVALELQRKINALKVITEPFLRPHEYDLNPNLRQDIRAKELAELIEILNDSKLKIKKLDRIECYDISNIQGTNATGSLVVLTKGEIDKSQYRKFKIKRKNTPNDFAMMEEVLRRRFNRTDWEIPNLIVVDGGKGQVTSALKALVASNVNIPIVGLAKREETIIIPIRKNFKEILLPKNSKALHLIMRIRDEAHRFAITYHKHLRSKQFLK